MPKTPGRAVFAVLAALLENGGEEVLDYEIGNSVRGVGPRAVYRILKGLEQDGWLSCRWDDERGRSGNKYIRLTGLGVLSADQLLGHEGTTDHRPPSADVAHSEDSPPRFFDQDSS